MCCCWAGPSLPLGQRWMCSLAAQTTWAGSSSPALPQPAWYVTGLCHSSLNMFTFPLKHAVQSNTTVALDIRIIIILRDLASEVCLHTVIIVAESQYGNNYLILKQLGPARPLLLPILPHICLCQMWMLQLPAGLD